MSDHVFRMAETRLSARKGGDDAVHPPTSCADQSVREVGGFQVAEARRHGEGGRMQRLQVTRKPGFKVDGALASR